MDWAALHWPDWAPTTNVDWSAQVQVALEKGLAILGSLEEVWPDVVAWLVVSSVAFSLLHFVVVRRPRSCGLVALTWLSWLGSQVWQQGPGALEATRLRGRVAVEATESFVKQMVALVQAWMHFFLPFLNDLCRQATALWRSVSPRTRMFLLCAAVTIYTTVTTTIWAYQGFRKHQNALARAVGAALFHSSFLVVGPLTWELSGRLPVHWLPFVLRHVVSTVPTVGSLLALGWRPIPAAKDQPQKAGAAEISNSGPQEAEGGSFLQRRTRRLSAAASALVGASPPAFAAEPVSPASAAKLSPSAQRLWLSYWASWPLIAVLELGLGNLHVAAPGVQDVQSLQSDLQRGLLVLALWLQLWGGSRLLQVVVRWLFGHLTMPAVLGRLAGQRGSWLLGLLRGGLGGVAAPSASSSLWLVRNAPRRMWLVWVGIFGGVLVFVVL
ncbi:unnamed protein product, partial [Polarella glacialis]